MNSCNFLPRFAAMINKELNAVLSFAAAVKPYCIERERILEEYSIRNFNIFTSIAYGR
jgi:hypothetical protein